MFKWKNIMGKKYKELNSEIWPKHLVLEQLNKKGAMMLKPCVRHVVITQNLSLLEDQGIWLVGS